MGDRFRGLIALGIVLGAGIFIGSAVSQWYPLPSQDGVVSPPRNATAAGLGRVRVEVLNAGGREGMARLATDHLRDRGFDVVYFGNAEVFGQDSTVVLDRAAKPQAAEAVARALGTPWVESQPD
ncbi:MAG TPA: LytR family transcriptional regulator, partial [Gemmatimonadetes bacterium]|nr:LytR family transcriptional regulator [Gemmatimonadota bacterium]